jgi:hypothetical protein
MPVTLGPDLGERGRAVIGIVDVLRAELLEQVTDDADHRVAIVDKEDRHRQINRHAPLAGPMRDLRPTGILVRALRRPLDTKGP